MVVALPGRASGCGLVPLLDRAKGLRNRFLNSLLVLSFLLLDFVLFDETGSGSWYGSVIVKVFSRVEIAASSHNRLYISIEGLVETALWWLNVSVGLYRSDCGQRRVLLYIPLLYLPHEGTTTKQCKPQTKPRYMRWDSRPSADLDAISGTSSLKGCLEIQKPLK